MNSGFAALSLYIYTFLLPARSVEERKGKDKASNKGEKKRRKRYPET